MDIIADIQKTFKQGSVLTRLIYINLGFFLFVKIVDLFFYLGGYPPVLASRLSVPSDLSLLVRRPWTPVSYMFLHTGFLHLLFNTLGLYWFGKLFLFRFEGEKLLSVYLLGGISGALLYVAAFNIFPAFTSMRSLMLGASGSVFAILVAIAVYDPNLEIRLFFIGRVALKYVAIFYVVLSITGISASNPGGNLAHLGGAAWGWLYIYQLRRGKDWGAGLAEFIEKLPGRYKRSNKSRMKVTYNHPPRSDYEYNRQQNIRQEEINRILDKIAKSGYESLTKKEKEILFKQGGK